MCELEGECMAIRESQRYGMLSLATHFNAEMARSNGWVRLHSEQELRDAFSAYIAREFGIQRA
jgi:hypothetical protein